MKENINFSIKKTKFGIVESKNIDIYTLTYKNGIEMKVTNYGCIVTSLKVPDKSGNMDDIVLGFNDLQTYLKGHPYFGAIIGRYGNRIANSKFSLKGKVYLLAKNDGPNNLHGGNKGFDKVVWDAIEIKDNKFAGIEFKYLSKDGEEGFPGNLSVTVTYTINDNNEFKIDYKAKTDAITICNLTHHIYFNLSGEGNGSILDHQAMIRSRRFTPIDSTLIPTGELADVTGTPFDFRSSTAIGRHINEDNMQLKYGGGYDHNWILDKLSDSKKVSIAASVYDPKSGRKMDVLTTEPGIQMYSGNFLDGTLIGKSGKKYEKRSGFCLETQHYPDSPNKPDFPTTILEPGRTYSTTTVYKFYC